jgi:hypothetical protein
MIIRNVVASDAANYFKLRVQSEEEFPQFVGLSVERELGAGREGVSSLLSGYSAEGTVVLGAFEGEQLFGALALSRKASAKYRHKAFLWGMYIFPEYRGAGVAQALMQAAIAWAEEQPEIIAITLQVTLSNIRGQQFYKRFGFTIFGAERRSLFAAGRFHDALYMELEVKAPQHAS